VQYVYLLRGDNGFYKIGISQNVESRLRHLSTSNPDQLSIVTTKLVDDAFSLEQKLHAKYAKYRTKANGEWFRLTAEDALDVCTEIHRAKSPVDETVTDVRNLSRQFIALRAELLREIELMKTVVHEMSRSVTESVRQLKQEKQPTQQERRVPEKRDGVSVVVSDARRLPSLADAELLGIAREVIRRSNFASISFLQRKLRIGFARAGRIIDKLEEDGLISSGHPRRVLQRGIVTTPHETKMSLTPLD